MEVAWSQETRLERAEQVQVPASSGCSAGLVQGDLQVLRTGERPWGKIGLTNIQPLAEYSHGPDRFALAESYTKALSGINILSEKAGLLQQPGAPAGGAVVTHVPVPRQEVRVFRNPANHTESKMTLDAGGAASMREKHPIGLRTGRRRMRFTRPMRIPRPRTRIANRTTKARRRARTASSRRT
jgi:hypothetical protein